MLRLRDLHQLLEASHYKLMLIIYGHLNSLLRLPGGQNAEPALWGYLNWTNTDADGHDTSTN